ncbi:MAG: hypothetical protein ABJH05_02810 [Fulvivirga sp.]
MSNKELDSLFKNKLENLERQPSAGAWNKIQAQTQQKKFGWLWIKVAAAILLLLVSGVVIWNASQDTLETNETIASSETKPEDIATEHQPEAESQIKNEVNTIEEPEKATSIVESIQQKAPKSEHKSNVSTPGVESKTTVATNASLPSVDEILEESETLIAQNEITDATNETQTTSTEQEVKGTTLEFNIEDFQKTQIAANTSNEVNSEEGSEPKKGLSKVLNLMKDIKSDAGIGDLREAKNEIFALNFKRDSNDDSK